MVLIYRRNIFKKVKEVFVPEELFKDFKKKGVPVQMVYCCDENGNCMHPELFENEFVILKADQSSKKTQLGRVEKVQLINVNR